MKICVYCDKRYIYTALLIVLFEPAYVQHYIYNLHRFNTYMMISSFVVLFIIWVVNRKNIVSMLVLCVYMIYIASTVYNHGDVNGAIYESLLIGTAVLLVNYVINNEQEIIPFFNALSVVCFLMCFLNFVSILATGGEGLYKVALTYINSYFFLGHRNTMSMLLLGYTILAIISNRVINDKWIFIPIFCYVTSAISIFVVWSATSIVGLTVLSIALVLIECVGLMPKLVYYAILSLSVVSTMLLLNEKSNAFFKFVLVNVLHKDLTLTSRSIVWNRAGQFVKMALFTGYGCETSELSYLKLYIGSTHNHYLQCVYSCGLVGLILEFIIIIFCGIGIKRENSRATKCCVAGLGAYFVIWITESCQYSIAAIVYMICVILTEKYWLSLSSLKAMKAKKLINFQN